MSETPDSEHTPVDAEHTPVDAEHTPVDAGEQFDAEEQFGAEELAAGENGSGAPGNGGSGVHGLQDADLRRVSEVPLELSVEIGRTRMTVGETLDLRAGSIVTLDRLAGEPVDLLVNGTPIARGEVVVVDEEFGLRVTEILEGDGEASADGQAPVEQESIESEAPA